MTQQEKIKSLTWKYFWKQKWNEIGEQVVLIGSIGVGFLIFLISKWLYEKYPSVLKILCFIFFCLVILFLVGVMISVFIDWIRNNWIEAKSRAIREVKNVRRKS